MPNRTPVAVIQETADFYPAVLCDDGSVWARCPDKRIWEEGPAVPGTRRAAEQAVTHTDLAALNKTPGE